MALKAILTRRVPALVQQPLQVWSTARSLPQTLSARPSPATTRYSRVLASLNPHKTQNSPTPRSTTDRSIPCEASTSQQAAPASESPQQITDRYDNATIRLVAASTVSFGLLLLPQILQNSLAMRAGDLASLSILSWVGFTTALFGNTVLLSYFVTRGEAGGARIQALGAVSNAAVLTQIFLAGHMPELAFYTLAAVEAVGMSVTAAKVIGLLGKGNGGIWQVYLDSLGVLAVAVLVQAVYMTVTGGAAVQPGIAAAASALLFMILDKTSKLPSALQGKWGLVPAWAATLLFGFQPVAQLVSNLKDPSSLAGIAVPSVVLATIANGLMVPRALFTSDAVWFAGSAWGSLMGWAQLLSLSLGTSSTGAPFLAVPIFGAITVAFFSYAALFLKADSRSKGYGGLLSSAGALLSGRTRPASKSKHPHAEVP